MSITLQLADKRDADLRDARIAGARRGVDPLAQRDLVGEGHEAERIVGAVHRLVGPLRRRGAASPFAGSSSFSVAAARSIAASLISLAWAKAVVSPVTPRRPKPDEL